VTTGNQAGEFTLWHGTTFNFDTIMAAHQHSILGMTYTNSGEFLISCDRVGVVKYWTHQMSQQAEVQAHAEACKAVTVSPLDRKFATASDDGTVKVWDFYGRVEERVLTGHNANVTSVAWHPAKSLLASSGKDNMVKLWDASSGKELRNLPGHTSWVLTTAWNPNGWWLLSGSRDNTLRVTDIRMMRVVQTMTAGHGGVTAAAWHPYTERLLVAGMADGAMQYWSVGQDFPQAEIPHAHDSSIWDFAWQPTGGILASVSNDFATKIWARSRPGDGALQYAYQGNPTKGHPPNNNPNLVPVPAGLGVGGALVAAQAALAAGGGAGAGASAALAGGKSFAELSFEEMESEARRTVFSGAGGRVPDIRPGAAFGGGGAAASGPRPPPGSYVCKKCNVPGHWVRHGFGVAGGGGPSDAIWMGGKVSKEPPIALSPRSPSTSTFPLLSRRSRTARSAAGPRARRSPRRRRRCRRPSRPPRAGSGRPPATCATAAGRTATSRTTARPSRRGNSSSSSPRAA
jgi:polyadenylation factor subunit 2